jgi:hypothetical protein
LIILLINKLVFAIGEKKGGPLENFAPVCQVGDPPGSKLLARKARVEFCRGALSRP